MKVFSDKFLVILTQKNKDNEMFFEKKILGLTSVQWIEQHLTSFFKGVFCSAKKESFKNFEECIFLDWDAPIASIEQLELGEDVMHLSTRTFPFIEETLQTEILNKLACDGVILHSKQNLSVDATAVIEKGVEIFAPTFIKGQCLLKKGTVVYPFCHLENVEMGVSCSVKSSTLQNCKIGDDCVVGPNTFVRPDSVIGNNCRVGDFVEIKASKIGNGTKIAHLAYVGDAEVGENVNIGCGAVFANYDGKKKHKTVVGDNCFIGSNVNLVAPVRVGKGSFIAAGTTVTDEIGENVFTIGRVRQTNKDRKESK